MESAKLQSEPLTLKGHTSFVESVAFSPDGKRLASGSEDETVKIWDAASGQETLTFKAHEGAVVSVAFSPDGRRLASASNDQTVKENNMVYTVAFSPDSKRLVGGTRDRTVKVWEVASGQETLTLKGHAQPVTSLAFSPDGKRLVSGSHDRTVKVWDTASGQETLTLKAHADRVVSVAFSPDGKQLASASADGTVKVWDGRELTPQLRVEREARGVLEFLCAKHLPKIQLIAAVRRDETIAKAVREQALAWAELYWDRFIEREARGIVEPLFDKLLLRPAVLQAIQADSALSDPVRERALALAEQRAEDPEDLRIASWDIVRRPGAMSERYATALKYAEAACRIEPQNGRSLRRLGMAQYRLGQYHEALATLTRSDSLNAKQFKGSIPPDLAFLAMTHHQLGNKDQAQATLARLREAMKNARWVKDHESLDFLKEAEELIEGKSAAPKK